MLFSLNAVALLAGSLGLVGGVRLSDFRPAVSGLSGTCDDVYRTQIPGCVTTDFPPAGTCSQACLQGLIQINALVGDACQNENIPSNSIVSLFLQGKGIRALCNVEVITTTTGLKSTATPAGGQTTKPQSPTTNTIIIGSAPPGQSTAAAPSPSQTTLSSSTITGSTQSGFIGKLTVAPPSSSTSSTSKPSSTRTNTSALPLCSSNTGGGSPFDQGSGQTCRNGASSLRLSLSVLVPGAIAALLANRIWT